MYVYISQSIFISVITLQLLEYPFFFLRLKIALHCYPSWQSIGYEILLQIFCFMKPIWFLTSIFVKLPQVLPLQVEYCGDTVLMKFAIYLLHKIFNFNLFRQSVGDSGAISYVFQSFDSSEDNINTFYIINLQVFFLMIYNWWNLYIMALSYVEKRNIELSFGTGWIKKIGNCTQYRWLSQDILDR